MNIKLYYSPISCSLVPYIALTEAHAAFEVSVVNFRTGMHLADDYVRLNPKHAVPVLVVDGEVLTENVAILQWIADAFPEAALLPTSGMRKFEAIAFLAWCASGIHPFLTPNVLPSRYCDIPGTEENVRQCAKKMLVEKFHIAEQRLEFDRWFFGDFTLADVYFFWCVRRALIFATDFSALPRCRAHFERVTERSSTQRLLQFEAETIKSLEEHPNTSTRPV